LEVFPVLAVETFMTAEEMAVLIPAVKRIQPLFVRLPDNT
jgi:hypothetical protein